ncbi:diguanylate cyclase [Massilia sp. CMS3.1]|uniref:sensor domain-containing diguanylate cyclase n=1 Tax=Massilia sp. CMS3.1 TaxID=3373083 RepID=UPI003EE71382
MNASVTDTDNHLVLLSSKKRPAARLVLLITTLACLLVLVAGARFVSTSRDTQLREAEVANTNIARMIAVQVESSLKTASVALVDIAERAEHDGVGSDAMERVQVHLVEIAKTSPELHGLFIYGADGAWLATALSRPSQGNNADREYFSYHRANPGREVHVGPPIKSRSTGVWIIPVSRRINLPDGSFGGVALVTLRVNFFERIYDELDVGATGTVFLALNEGTLVYRRPFDEKLIGTNISQGPVLQALRKHGPGSSILVSRIDGIERLYSYRSVDNFPFAVAVGRTKDELLANWQRSAILLGAAVLAICAMFALLAKKLIRQIIIRDRLDEQLRARSDDLEQHNVGLHHLAHTDKITGVANRLAFDEVLEGELRRAQRGDNCLSLIMLDVDYFKKFNDRYGHPAGDTVLRGIGRVLSEQIIRAGDLCARYGGEEFVVVLPSTGRAGAAAVAERIRAAILALELTHADSPMHIVSASFGVATIDPGADANLRPADIIERADRQLYEAKRGGRNRVCGETAA